MMAYTVQMLSIVHSPFSGAYWIELTHFIHLESVHDRNCLLYTAHARWMQTMIRNKSDKMIDY